MNEYAIDHESELRWALGVVSHTLDLAPVEIPVEIKPQSESPSPRHRLSLSEEGICVAYRSSDLDTFGSMLRFGDALGDAVALIRAFYAPDSEAALLQTGEFPVSAATQLIISNLIHEAACGSSAPLMKDLPSVSEDQFLACLLASLIGSALLLDRDLIANRVASPDERWRRLVRRRYALPLWWIEALEGREVRSGGAILAALGARAASLDPRPYFTDPASACLEQLSATPVLDPLSIDPRTDIPSQIPALPVALASAGCRRIRAPLSFLDPFTKRRVVSACSLTLTAALSPHQRGLHMSRLQEAVVAASNRHWNDLREAADHLATQAFEDQQALGAEVALETDIFYRKHTEVTSRPTLQPIRLRVRTQLSPEGYRRSLSVRIGIMTACPCTLAYSRLKAIRGIRQALRIEEAEFAHYIPPTFTHSQPGSLTAEVETVADDEPGCRALYEALDGCTHLVESVLKRPDEHALVERAHRRPQFCEDVARSAAVAVASLCSTPNDLVYITVELDESIHPHTAFAEIREPALHLWQANDALSSCSRDKS